MAEGDLDLCCLQGAREAGLTCAGGGEAGRGVAVTLGRNGRTPTKGPPMLFYMFIPTDRYL